MLRHFLTAFVDNTETTIAEDTLNVLNQVSAQLYDILIFRNHGKELQDEVVKVMEVVFANLSPFQKKSIKFYSPQPSQSVHVSPGLELKKSMLESPWILMDTNIKRTVLALEYVIHRCTELKDS